MAWTVTTSFGSFGRLGEPFIASETALNDSDKTLVLATDFSDIKGIVVDGIRVEYVASATVGNRGLTILVTDGGDTICEVPISTATKLVTASQTQNAEFSASSVHLASTSNTDSAGADLQAAYMPVLYLPRSSSIRVFDSAAVDAAADDMIVHIRGRRF